MTNDGFRGMRDEVVALRRMLDRLGVSHEDSNEITYFVNADGECAVFPSVQHEGRLFVTYTASGYCDTPAQALHLCGIGKGEKQ